MITSKFNQVTGIERLRSLTQHKIERNHSFFIYIHGGIIVLEQSTSQELENRVYRYVIEKNNAQFIENRDKTTKYWLDIDTILQVYDVKR